MKDVVRKVRLRKEKESKEDLLRRIFVEMNDKNEENIEKLEQGKGSKTAKSGDKTCQSVCMVKGHEFGGF